MKPLRLDQKLATLDEAAEHRNLTRTAEAAVRARIEAGHSEHAGEPEVSVAIVSEDCLQEALDLFGHPCRLYWQDVLGDEWLMACQQAGEKLMNLWERLYAEGNSTPPAPVATQQGTPTGQHARLCATCENRNPFTICIQVAMGKVPEWIAKRGGYVNGAPCWQYRTQGLTREQAVRDQARAICGQDADPDPDPQRQWASVHATEVPDEH